MPENAEFFSETAKNEEICECTLQIFSSSSITSIDKCRCFFGTSAINFTCRCHKKGFFLRRSSKMFFLKTVNGFRLFIVRWPICGLEAQWSNRDCLSQIFSTIFQILTGKSETFLLAFFVKCLFLQRSRVIHQKSPLNLMFQMPDNARASY